MSTADPGLPVFEEFIDPADGVRWRVDVGFLRSSWTCTWGCGCAGILDHPSSELKQGCCSVGAELLDDDEARTIAALGLTLDPSHFQFHEAAADGVLAPETTFRGRPATRVVEGACIFLNRPGFAGGEGCALHLAAEADGESPVDWKPSVCWQLPLKVEEAEDGARVLRRWQRSDWGDGGHSMAWCCTEGPEPSAYVGEAVTGEQLADEIEALVGSEVAVAIGARLNRERAGPPRGRPRRA